MYGFINFVRTPVRFEVDPQAQSAFSLALIPLGE
jgi:hypothetical protein